MAMSIGRGIDQNVNQGPTNTRYVLDGPTGPDERELTEDFKPHHDQYTMLSGDYSREVTPNGTVGFAQFLARRNDHLRQYDSASLFAGVESPWRMRQWTVRTTATLGLVSLGGHLYQRQAQLQARVGPPLPLPSSFQFSMLGGATYSDFQTLTNFNSTTFELRGLLTWRNADLFASASLGALSDHALAQRPGGDRNGSFGNVLLRRRLSGRLSGELAYTRQTWDSRLPYAPGVIDEVRQQATQVLRANLVYSLTRYQSLQLEARAVRNRENISIFQYNNRQLQLSWQCQGP
jgi:hypothetical protein